MVTLGFSLNDGAISGNLVQSLLLTFIAFVVWYSLYRLFSVLEKNKKLHSSRKPLIYKYSFMTSTFITMPFIWYVYCDNWSYFYSVDVDHKIIRLQYFLPEREAILYHSEIDELKVQSVWRKSTYYRLVVVNVEGKIYSSQLVDREKMVRNLSKLPEHLGKNAQL